MNPCDETNKTGQKVYLSNAIANGSSIDDGPSPLAGFPGDAIIKLQGPQQRGRMRNQLRIGESAPAAKKTQYRVDNRELKIIHARQTHHLPTRDVVCEQRAIVIRGPTVSRLV